VVWQQGSSTCGSGVVLGTFRSAIDADYNVIVVRNACADRHALMNKYYTNRFGMGCCMTAEEVAKSDKDEQQGWEAVEKIPLNVGGSLCI